MLLSAIWYQQTRTRRTAIVIRWEGSQSSREDSLRYHLRYLSLRLHRSERKKTLIARTWTRKLLRLCVLLVLMVGMRHILYPFSLPDDPAGVPSRTIDIAISIQAII